MSNKDFFQHKANEYDRANHRVANVDRIAKAIQTKVNLKPDMHIMDFGSGTGLLLERIAPFVKKITAVDVSPSMNQQLESKRSSLACELEILNEDLTQNNVDKQFDGIISSMTLHHIADIPAIFSRFNTLLKPGGFIALADLDTEDGSFHTEDTGVFHFGFDREEMTDTAIKADFQTVKTLSASTVQKPHGEYSVFLLTASKG